LYIKQVILGEMKPDNISTPIGRMRGIVSNTHIGQFLLCVVSIASAAVFQVATGNSMKEIWPVISAKNQVTLSMVRAIYAPQMKFAQGKIGIFWMLVCVLYIVGSG